MCSLHGGDHLGMGTFQRMFMTRFELAFPRKPPWSQAAEDLGVLCDLGQNRNLGWASDAPPSARISRAQFGPHDPNKGGAQGLTTRTARVTQKAGWISTCGITRNRWFAFSAHRDNRPTNVVFFLRL